MFHYTFLSCGYVDRLDENKSLVKLIIRHTWPTVWNMVLSSRTNDGFLQSMSEKCPELMEATKNFEEMEFNFSTDGKFLDLYNPTQLLAYLQKTPDYFDTGRDSLSRILRRQYQKLVDLASGNKKSGSASKKKAKTTHEAEVDQEGTGSIQTSSSSVVVPTVPQNVEADVEEEDEDEDEPWVSESCLLEETSRSNREEHYGKDRDSDGSNCGKEGVFHRALVDQPFFDYVYALFYRTEHKFVTLTTDNPVQIRLKFTNMSLQHLILSKDTTAENPHYILCMIGLNDVLNVLWLYLYAKCGKFKLLEGLALMIPSDSERDKDLFSEM